jgi:putative MATE family efflux protein
MEPQSRAHLLGEAKILPLIWKFSLPAIVGMLTNALYNVVDRIFLGQGVGSLAIAGTTICFPIMMVMMALTMLIGIGSSTLISIRLGEGKHEDAEKIMGQAFLFICVFFGAFMVLGLSFINQFLFLFGATDTILPYAKEYMSVILFGAPLFAIGSGINHCIRAEGNPKIAMLTMLIGGLLNIALDPLFIFVFNMGIRGAALATVISMSVSSLWVLMYFIKGKSIIKIRVKYIRYHKGIARNMLTNGSAAFALQMVASVLNIILNQSLKTYGGDLAISAMGIIQSTFTFVVMPIFGLNQGLQPIFGYNYGAKKIHRVFDTLKYGSIIATLIVTFSYLIIRLFPTALIHIFNRSEPDLIALTKDAIFWYSLCIPLIGFQIVSVGFFQALGKPKRAMFLSLSRQIIFLIPLLLILPRFFSLSGIWYSIPISDVLSFLFAVFFVAREIKKLQQFEKAGELT